MPEWTAELIAQTAFDHDLIDQQQLREMWSELGSTEIDPEQFQQHLLRRELLTNLQIKKLLRGDRLGYFYGPYKVLYKVGSGTFARVYRAMHRETREVRAVKVLRDDRQFNPDLEKRQMQIREFVREGELGMSLRHPNIVPIYEVVSDKKASYFVMEFVEGRNLRLDLRSQGRYDAMKATKICIDMCRGLDYAFQRGVSHRDLKASNVLLSSLGQAKLLDFGLAGQDVDDSDSDSDKIENQRTVDYTALEKTTGVPRDDSRSDIFFLGCIYYQMLCGKPALEETQDRRARMGRERFDAMVPIGKVMPELSPEAAGVVNKSVMMEPDRRYQTPGEMLRELLALSEFLASGNAVNGKVRKAGASMLKQRTVMIVEPNAQVQEALRTHFKQEGFRVLVTADSHRPASMFSETNTPADCVIFSTSSLGEEALSAFNDFGDMPATKQLPAILLLGPRHLNWADRAKTNDRRMTVATPIKMKRLLAQLEQMIPAKTG